MLSDPYCQMFFSLSPSGNLKMCNRPSQLSQPVSRQNKQGGWSCPPLLSLITTDPTSLHPFFSDTHFISVKGHFHRLSCEDATEMWTGGLRRYVEVRLRGLVAWVLLNSRARYIRTCDELTQLLATLVFYFSVFIMSMNTPETSFHLELYFIFFLSLC